MAIQTWQQMLTTAVVDGPTLASFTTATSMLPPANRITLPANFFYINKVLRITASGRISNVVTAQPTFSFTVKLGSVVVFDGGAMLCSTTAHTTVPWRMVVDLTCRSVGNSTSATLFGQGVVTSRAFLDSGATADLVTGGHPELLIPETTPAVGTGFDSTVTNIVDVFAACSASNAANGLTLHQYWLEDLS